MRVKFNGVEYKYKGHNNTGLGVMCFEVFKFYLKKNPHLEISVIKNIFNNLHCRMNTIIQRENEFNQLPKGTQKRYFPKTKYNEENLYFSTQWGNEGKNNIEDCDNINHIINFAKNEKYNIEVIEEKKFSIFEKESILNYTKNIILYGSPGVGKTHNTNRLIRLIEDGDSDSQIFKTIKDNELTESIDISDIKERVKFITFHQSFGYEDFIEGFRPNEEGNIELTKGIFREICRDAQQNLDDSQKEKSTISQEKLFEELFELFKEFIQDELDSNGKFTINDTAYIINIEEDAFRYQGDNWGNTQRMKYSDIELLYQLDISERKEIKTVEGISGLAKQHATYFSYFMKQFLEFKEKQNIQIDEVEKVELKNYYLVIDEINRGNISKIFGELITLIEEDKRDKLEVTLPYSKQSFKIPSNLYIIGTMNSTDKSIALIDIALRRRFTFLKMKPNVELVPIESQELFKNLNEYISKILGEDYQIGHSYFMGGHDLDFILEYKIKPLLEEYFYGDDKGLDEVLKLVKNYERS